MNSHNLSLYEHLFNKTHDGNQTWKIAVYVRLSKEDGNSVSLSIINQIKKIARYLVTLEDFTIVDIYIDDGLTGTDFERSDYQRLEQDINNKFINCIIVKDLTRYARNLADGIKGLDCYVLEKKIRFISCSYPEVDTFKNPQVISSPEVYQALQNAEDFARITSRKVRDIKEIKREAGEKNGGFPPYGYLPNPDGEHWLYDPVAGKIIEQMYLWSLEGLSDKAIARKLNDLKIPNPTAYKKSIGLNYQSPRSEENSGLWWATTIRKILSDKTNIGCSVQGKSTSFDHKRHKQIPIAKENYVVVENVHKKAVSDDLFNQVSEIRSKRSRTTKTGKVHLFANLVYCSNCKRAMKKTSAKGKSYLVCRTYKELGSEYCEKKRTISFKVLEDVILKTIQMQIKLVLDMQTIVEKINQQGEIKTQSQRLINLIASVQQTIVKTEHIFDSAYYDWKNEEISKEQYNRIRTETEKKLEQLRETLRLLLLEQNQIECGIKTNNDYFNRFLKYKNIDTIDRLMLVELIDKIYINEDKSIEVNFKFQNQYLIILDYIKQNENKEPSSDKEQKQIKEKKYEKKK